jgi:hypothetical protein
MSCASEDQVEVRARLNLTLNVGDGRQRRSTAASLLLTFAAP